jgi:DNA-binding MarR family transcriptional regulator
MMKKQSERQGRSGTERSDNPRFTPRQGQMLAFIYYYTKIHKCPPAEADIAAYFGVSPPSTHQSIMTLARHGLIARIPGQSRSIRVLLPREDLPDLE